MPGVDEGRKRVLLIAASILAAHKRAQLMVEEGSGDDERNRGRSAMG